MTPLYTAMDVACAAHPVRSLCHDPGIVSLIGSNSRGQEKILMDPDKEERDKTRSSVERVDFLPKDALEADMSGFVVQRRCSRI